ncbi:MAG: Flp pilus assembly complex ATPase component TadA [Gemmatimonadetes bacterium]|nr:Flp pilus assembly complex ATPase component TadA [Gemmatimonadota bacterium]
MPEHWLVRVMETAGVSCAAGVDVAPATPAVEAWKAVLGGCTASEEELAQHIAAHFKLAVADLEHAQPTALRLIPEKVARRYWIYPLRQDDRHLYVATIDPTAFDVEQAVGFASGRTPIFEIAGPAALSEAIDLGYTPDKVIGMLDTMDGEVADAVKVVEDLSPEMVLAQEAEAPPIVRLTNLILRSATNDGASDIHIEPGRASGTVRFRIDGVLRQYMELPMAALNRVVSRIKILGKLDIADRLRPQDGRTRIEVDGRTYDLRIATVPTREAEKVVIRILDPEGSKTLEALGVPKPELKRMRYLLSHRDGIVVVTGPTGSGKTTTLYAALREIATGEVNIMTVEDPVEYELKGITQIQVEPKRGVTFASALRALLRQDPDVIFVGEIRDLETAQIAVQASMTGHLVLATLHTNDAISVVPRLVDLGLDRASIAATLRGALAQRLLRHVCDHCAEPIQGPLDAAELRLSAAYGAVPVVRGAGCKRCGQTGHRGRIPIMEVLVASPELEELINRGASLPELLRVGVGGGMRTMREVALERVSAGQTTLQEVERVLGELLEVAPEVVDQDAANRGMLEKQGFVVREADIERLLNGLTPPPSTQAAQPHILVVDDDGVSRSLARTLLEKNGFRVTEAADGAAALDRIRDGNGFALVVLDLDMPRLDGREVLSRLRGSSETAKLPVVVLTGSESMEAEIELMDRGADDYIRKPIDAMRFVARIKAALRRAGA